MWLDLLWYLLYCDGLEPNPEYLQGTSVIVLAQHNRKDTMWYILTSCGTSCGTCHRPCLCHSPPNSYVEIYSRSVMVFRGEGFWRWWIIRVESPREFSPHFHRVRRQREDCCLQEVGTHRTWNLLVPWPWTSQPPELWEINFFVYKLPNLWDFVTATWMD